MKGDTSEHRMSAPRVQQRKGLSERISRSSISACLLSHGDSDDWNRDEGYMGRPEAGGRGKHTRSRGREAVVFVLMGEDGWLRQQHVHLGVDAGESPRDVKLS